MNEITNIHLGRQAFTIAVDAHVSLRTYLDDIKTQVGSSGGDVVREVELRMAELLSERGIGSEKVILAEDVSYLKQQLGDPTDFKDEDDSTAAEQPAVKRLFRDPEHGMLAGVSAGLSNYFGVDVLLVRILFVIGVLGGGWGILIYIALWLLVPEARSSSERLQMEGKAVTVDSLKSLVARADVPGVAHRARGTLVPWINSVFRVVLKLAGVFTILCSLAVFFGLLATSLYVLLDRGNSSLQAFFPFGTKENLLAAIGLAFLALATVFMVVLGLAMVRRRWPIAPWATGILISLLFVGLASGIALGADVAPTVRQRFISAHHSSTSGLEPFTTVNVTGERPVEFRHGDGYAISYSYVNNPDIKVSAGVVGQTLELNTDKFSRQNNCSVLCLFPDYDLTITVYSPNTPAVTYQGRPVATPAQPPFEVNSN